ncbi:unnamed protein product, partial [Symbiodinium sp. CCMP2456]
MRGLAAGVALAAKLPSRSSNPPLPTEVSATCRLMESFVRLGALEPDARERTNGLLQHAFHRAAQNQAFQGQGYRDIFDLHHNRTGQELPPTCRGSTRHDSALLHPALAFSDAFAAHAPGLLREAHRCSSLEEVGVALQAFSQAAEASVGAALAKQHALDPVQQPLAHLPRKYRGRCCPRELVKKEAAVMCRPDREGGYTPDVEVTSVLARLKVRQVRRLITFQRGLAKAKQIGLPPSPSCTSQLRAEWRAIVKAHGYGPAFPSWVLDVACFHEFHLDLPPADWLSDLVAYVRYDCDCTARQEARRRKDDFLSQVSIDAEVGGNRQGFRAMSAAPNPPFTEVPSSASAEVQQVSTGGSHDDVAYALSSAALFVCGLPAKLQGQECIVQQATADAVVLRGQCLPPAGLLEQSYIACTAPELHAAFEGFWCPLWQRDKGQRSADISSWPQLQAFLARSALSFPEVHLQCSPEQWREAIRRMPARKATGVCGWSPTDLKLLPDQALEILSAIFQAAVLYGLPEYMLQARVCVLAKVHCPSHIKQSRPITVFSTLYRVWASVVTREILQAWSQTFPPAVMGSMPGKACRDLSYRQQHWIERALLTGTPRHGFSLDIIKCFNQLGWPAIEGLLVRLGVPGPVVHFWIDCLRKLRRHTSFLGDLSKGTKCFNGAPEGDPLSVAALAGVCCFAEEACRTAGVDYDTYVDNWSWSGPSTTGLEDALPKALGFLEALSLPVDWTKSYTWSTNAAGRAWWKKAHNRVFPQGAEVHNVSEVRDLGVAFKFDGRIHAVSRNARIQDGIDRLERLRNQPRSPSLKASMIQRGVWTATLYGAEGHAFSLADFRKLRGSAARTIVGQYKVMSPFLALASISSSCQDPQLYCLEQQLQVLRRVSQQDADLALSVLELAALDPPHRVCHGPATALRISLDRLGLSLSSSGLLKGLDNTWVDVTACHRKELHSLLQRSWSRHVQEQVSHRNGLHNAPEVHTAETGRLLQSFSAKDQMILTRHITGAFSSAASKNQWEPEIPAECPLCGIKQTKAHKFLHCPKLQHVRAPCAELLEKVSEDWPHWIHAPYAAMPGGLEVNRLIFATRDLLLPQTTGIDQKAIGPRPFLRFFTDGSCRYPTFPDASFAGFAVLLDTSPSDDCIPALLAKWRSSGTPPREFRILHQGLVPGVQSINRAELCAIIQALRLAVQMQATECEIWSDSAFAIREVARTRNGLPSTWPDLGAILGRLPLHLARLRKVASHQNLAALSGMEQWVAAGNEAADVAAKAAVSRELSCVQETAETAQCYLAEQRVQLQAFWRYLLQVSAEEMRLLREQGSGSGAAIAVLTQTAAVDAWLALNSGPFQTWELPPIQRAWVLACSWPPRFVVAVWAWLQTLQWTYLPNKSRAPSGVSYVELLVDFVLKSGMCPPAGLNDSMDAAEEFASLPEVPSTLRQLNHSLVEVVRQLERLSGVTVWPARRGKVFSLRVLGCKAPRIGLCLRPLFDFPTDVVQMLQAVLKEASVEPLRAFCRGKGNTPSSDDEQVNQLVPRQGHG